MDEIVISGKNAVLEILESGRRNINKIVVQKGLRPDEKLNRIVELAREQKVLFKFMPKELIKMPKDVSFQGVAAFVAPVDYIELEEFLDSPKENSKIVIIDRVEDPHNLGAVIRTAVCAGFEAVIIGSRHGTPVNATVEKTSAGAINYISLIKVNSLSATIDKLKKHAYWIIATDANGNDNYFDIDYKGLNTALILSSEGKGVNKTLLNQADYTVKIPMENDFNSLNVSNAAAIIMYEIVRQNIKKH